jgi:ribose transport system substrate-binding protein
MSKVNAFFCTIAAAALTLPLVNCGGSAHDPSEVFYLVTANAKIPYWRAAAAGLAQAAAEYQVRYDTVGPDNYDPQAELQEFRNLRQKKPTGILVSAADPVLMKPEIDAAIAQGIPVMTVDADSPASKRLTFIGTDNYEAGRRGGALLVRLLNGKGDVIMYTMPEQANLQDRLHGYEEVLKSHPGVKIVDTINMKGDPRIAFDRTMDLVDKKRPVDAFVCLEALSCPEIADVLDREKVTGKVVIAMDTDPRTLEWIQKGVIAATLAQRPYTMAYFGLKMLDLVHHQKLPSLLVNWAQDSRSPIPGFVDTGATLVDKSNIASFVKANPASSGSNGS